MKKFLKTLPVVLASLCLAALPACDDNDGDSPVNHFHPNIGGSSTDRYVTSENGPKNGQSERSSDNFSTKDMKGSSIIWYVEDDITFDIKCDVSGKDPYYATNVKNGTVTPNTNADNLYIANPKNAPKHTFQVHYRAFDPDDGSLIIWSAKDHQNGQSHRSSDNFEFGPNCYYRVECPSSVTFDIYEDVSGANDNRVYTGVKNGTVLERSQYDDLYIYSPQGASDAFSIKFVPLDYPWMKNVPDNTLISSLTIPGTHDSGTKKAGTGYSMCQHFTIEEQLYAGIRFFDVRLNEDLELCHADDGCEVYFDQVLTWMNNFLDSHPTEMLIMRVKQEKGSISGRLRDFFNDHSDLVKYVSRKETLPSKLGDARKSIVMLREFPRPEENKEWGVDITSGWPHDCAGTLTTPKNEKIYIEDRYYSTSEAIHDTNEKQRLVREGMEDANANTSIYHLIFTSIATRAVTGPYDYAWGGNTCDNPMNPWLSNHLDGLLKSRPYHGGIVIMDFYSRNGNDNDWELVPKLINLNFTTDVVPYLKN